jgi:tripartite-type tricarboxylate transporter receptor subunit TctC
MPIYKTICAAALLLHATGFAWAEGSYPSRSVTIVVPFPAGGPADLFPRLLAELLRAALGQAVVIENRSGAGGNTGLEFVARAAPDGYTLLNAPQLSFSVNHLLHPNLRVDPRALEPVSVLATYPTVILARPDLPVDSLPDLIAYAKANPGKLSYGSQGLGQIGHLTIEALNLREGLKTVHVPYRGSAPAINDLLAGHIDILADTMLAGMQHVQSGKLKLIAVGSQERLKTFPAVKTFNETVPGYFSDTWMAIAAPATTPSAITQQLSAVIAEAMQTPDVVQRIRDLYAEPLGSSPGQMRVLINESYDRWAPVITQANIKVE